MFKLFTIFYFFFAFSRALAQDWEASNYPNPTSQFAQCNMKSRSMVCDPDKVLNEQERYRLHYELNRLESLTKQVSNYNMQFNNKRGLKLDALKTNLIIKIFSLARRGILY